MAQLLHSTPTTPLTPPVAARVGAGLYTSLLVVLSWQCGISTGRAEVAIGKGGEEEGGQTHGRVFELESELQHQISTLLAPSATLFTLPHPLHPESQGHMHPNEGVRTTPPPSTPTSESGVISPSPFVRVPLSRVRPSDLGQGEIKNVSEARVVGNDVFWDTLATPILPSNRERLLSLQRRGLEVLHFLTTQCTPVEPPTTAPTGTPQAKEAFQGAIATHNMSERVSRSDLWMVRLWRFHVIHEGEDKRQSVALCDPSQCPSFKACPGERMTSLSECSWGIFNDSANVVPSLPLNCPGIGSECVQREDSIWHPRFVDQVFRISGGVYVSPTGVTFNTHSVFDRHGCVQDDPGLSYQPGNTTVVEVEGPVMGLLYKHGSNFYHTLIELVAAFVMAQPFLRAHPLMPVLMSRWQRDFYKVLTVHLVGIPLEDMNIIELRHGQLLHTQTLIQPVFQKCGYPSPSVQQYLRSRYYLPQNGLPLFERGWVPRRDTPLSPAELAHTPPDWVVVLGTRPGLERNIVGVEVIKSALDQLFGAHRVHSFSGSRPILQVKDLFNRAVLFVAAHGAAMTNMLFMPVDSSVLEIRPRDYHNACYHHLASASQLRYYLVFGNGTKHTPLVPNVTEVLGLLSTIAEELREKGILGKDQ